MKSPIYLGYLLLQQFDMRDINRYFESQANTKYSTKLYHLMYKQIHDLGIMISIFKGLENYILIYWRKCIGAYKTHTLAHIRLNGGSAET